MYGGHLGLLAFSEWAGDCVRDKRQAPICEGGCEPTTRCGQVGVGVGERRVWCEGKGGRVLLVLAQAYSRPRYLSTKCV